MISLPESYLNELYTFVTSKLERQKMQFETTKTLARIDSQKLALKATLKRKWPHLLSLDCSDAKGLPLPLD